MAADTHRGPTPAIVQAATGISTANTVSHKGQYVLVGAIGTVNHQARMLSPAGARARAAPRPSPLTSGQDIKGGMCCCQLFHVAATWRFHLVAKPQAGEVLRQQQGGMLGGCLGHATAYVNQQP